MTCLKNIKQQYQTFVNAQTSPASKLIHLIKKHRHADYCRPFPNHQEEVFAHVSRFVENKNLPIILDSFCGTGMSSRLLAEKNPHKLVIAFDKSLARLDRGLKSIPENCLILRAEAMDLWRFLYQQQYQISEHYILYPNPWPKASQLKRRFYAHPTFTYMAELSPYVEMRTNWQIFALEAKIAFESYNFVVTLGEVNRVRKPISLFEKKYFENDCPLYSLTAKK
jgi:tRNA (guanine-N7-)-methyltransferase